MLRLMKKYLMFMEEVKIQKNVLGEDLEECSSNPLTGWFRDGCCNTDENDVGVHTVCLKLNSEFLEWLRDGMLELLRLEKDVQSI